MITMFIISSFLWTLVTMSAQSDAAMHLPLWEMILQEYRKAVTDPETNVLDTTNILPEYDFIVIGAGPAGSVVTNRLTEVPGWRVLLIEAGKDEICFTDIPATTSYLQLTDYNWGYKTQPSNSACLGMKQRRCVWPRGKAVGGSSVLNYMINTRGSKQDYDDWEAMGNTGWGYDDVLPYFLKSEDMTIPELANTSYHSTGGYLTIEKATWHTPLKDAFLKAAEELGNEIGDYNGESQTKYSYIQLTTRKGRRVSAAKAFLRPIRFRQNFHLVKRALATKIVIDSESKKANGIEFVKNGKKKMVKATKEIILSAGAINSPQLLMLSGIGPREHLEELGIPVIQDLKVGHNLQDHVGAAVTVFLINDSVSLLESRYNNPTTFFEYHVNNNGSLTNPGGAEGIGWERTKYADPADDRPDVEIVLGSGCLNSEPKAASVRTGTGITDEAYNTFFGPIDDQDVWSATPVTMRPQSRGLVKLRSKNPFHKPLMYHNYFEVPRDMEIMIEGVKKIIDLSQTNAFQKYDSTLHRIPVAGCQDLEFGTDTYWECAIRHHTIPLHHQCGTCKMGPPSDPNAVVDPELKVYGISGLRVIDASIIPTLPTAHLTTPCYMIGEKGADLIKKTWGKA